MIRTRTWTILLIVCFAFLFFIRFIHLTADPPYNLSQSGAPWGDPGGYSFNARNKVLFGTWEVDNYNMMYSSYPPHLITYFFFRIFGVGFAQQNSIPVLFSCLSLLFLFLLLRRRYGPQTALLGAFLLGLNYTFLMYSRIANREMPVIFFMILGIYLLQKGEEKPFWNIGAGVSLVLALISKSFIFFAVGAILLGYFLYILFEHKIKDIFIRLALLLTGALTVLIPWILFVFLPKQEYITSFSRLNIKYLLPPINLSRLLEYFWTRPPLLLEQIPILSILATLFSLYLLYKAVHWFRDMQLLEWIFLGWFLIGFLYLSLIYQRFPRRFVAQIVPIVFLVILMVSLAFKKNKQKREIKPKVLFLPMFFLWMLFPVSLFLKFLWQKSPKLFPGQTSLNTLLLLISLILTAGLFLLLKYFIKRFPICISNRFKKGGFLVLAAVFLISHGQRYLRWAIDPPYQLKEISQDYGKAFQNAAFAGLWAPVVCMENNHRAYEYFRGFINHDKDFFEKFGITHVFTTTHFGEDRNFRQDFPRIMRNAQFIARYHIWTVQALLFDIHPAPHKKTEGFYEAELFTLRGSIPRYDEDASNKFAVLCRLKNPHHVINVPIEKTLENGIFEVALRLRLGKTISGTSSRLARLDVATDGGKKVLGYRDLFPADFSSNRYHVLTFPLRIRIPSSVEIRFRIDGGCPIWIDWVRIQ